MNTTKILLLMPSLILFANCPALSQVTQETLTTLRAERGSDATNPFAMGVDSEGRAVVVPSDDGNADHLSAVSALKESYDVPICREYAHIIPFTRFPYAILPNQRLVDALDSLSENSGGVFQWKLLNERIILASQRPLPDGETYVMDRLVRVKIQTDNLPDALRLIETAYNEQYQDIPLIALESLPKLDKVLSVGGKKFAFEGKTSLRGIVLGLLDQAGDPWLCYEFSERYDLKKRRYYTITLSKRGIDDQYENEEDYVRAKAQLNAFGQRRDQYLDRAEQWRQTSPAGEDAPVE